MANNILTPTLVAKESSMILAHKLGFANTINRRYDDNFATKGAKEGSTFDLRIPPRYAVTEGVAMAATPQDSEETTRRLTIEYDHVSMIFKDSELLLDINSFGDQFLKQAVAALANFIDFQGTKLYADIPNAVGTMGSASPPSALSTYLNANAILTEEGAPEDDRMVCLNARQHASIVDGLKGLYNDQAEIAAQYRMAKVRQASNLWWKSDQNMYLHTNGTRVATTTLIMGVPTSGDDTIAVDGLGTTTIKRGDLFTVANVYAVDPQSRQSTRRLRNFVVLEDAVGASGAIAALKIFPAMVNSGKDQTIDALPVDNAELAWNGGPSAVSHQGLAYHPECFALAMVDDTLPDGVDFAAKTGTIEAQDWNVSVSIIRDYDISKHNYPCRVGAYYGWVTARPELGVRVIG